MPHSSPRWLRYSTSITQKRPVPNRRVCSSLTETSRCALVIMSPGRIGSWKVVTFSVMTASGSSKRAFMSKWICSGSFSTVRPGAQWCGRNHADNSDGGATGPSVISSATASSQKMGLPFSTDAALVQK